MNFFRTFRSFFICSFSWAALEPYGLLSGFVMVDFDQRYTDVCGSVQGNFRIAIMLVLSFITYFIVKPYIYEAVLVPNLSENFLFLSRSNEKLSRSNEKPSRSNEKLSHSNEKLSRSNEKVSRSNEKLSRSNEKLSRSNEKIISF